MFDDNEFYKFFNDAWKADLTNEEFCKLKERFGEENYDMLGGYIRCAFMEN